MEGRSSLQMVTPLNWIHLVDGNFKLICELAATIFYEIKESAFNNNNNNNNNNILKEWTLQHFPSSE